MNLEANKFGTLDFTIYPGHPEYGQIEKLTSLISLYKDDTLYMQFRPTYKKQTFRGGILYKCKEITCRLNDFKFRTLTYTGTIDGFVTAVLTAYNGRVSSDEQFIKGNVSGGSTAYSIATDKPLGCWDELQTVTSANGGYFVARYTSSAVYLDYKQDADLPVSSQIIQFGQNMTDLFIETDADSTYSVLYPIGTNGQETITIESVNGGVDYLESSAGIALYGRRETSITWENVDSASQLKTLAQAKLDEIAVKFEETVQVSAIDLHNADTNITTFNFLDKVDCVSTPHGFSHRYVLGRIQIPLGSPKSSVIQLGEKRTTLNDRVTLEKKETEAAINDTNTRVSTLQTNIDTVNGRVTTEAERAQTAESTISGNIKETWREYALSSSALNHPNTGWETAMQTPTTAYPYVWSREAVSKNNGATTYRDYRREYGFENVAGYASDALVIAGGIADGTTAVPRVSSTGIEVDGDTLLVKSVGNIQMLGNSSLYFGSSSSNSAVILDGNGVSIGSGGSIAIAAGGTFEIASRNFSIDANGNVELRGKISSGDIGGFEIGPGYIGSQSGNIYMSLGTSGHSAGITVFPSSGNRIPFYVDDGGTAIIAGERISDGWIKDATVSGNTLTLTKYDGTTVNFNKGSTMTGAWSGNTYTVTNGVDTLTTTISTTWGTQIVSGYEGLYCTTKGDGVDVLMTEGVEYIGVTTTGTAYQSGNQKLASADISLFVTGGQFFTISSTINVTSLFA